MEKQKKQSESEALKETILSLIAYTKASRGEFEREPKCDEKGFEAIWEAMSESQKEEVTRTFRKGMAVDCHAFLAWSLKGIIEALPEAKYGKQGKHEENEFKAFREMIKSMMGYVVIAEEADEEKRQSHEEALWDFVRYAFNDEMPDTLKGWVLDLFRNIYRLPFKYILDEALLTIGDVYNATAKNSD